MRIVSRKIVGLIFEIITGHANLKMNATNFLMVAEIIQWSNKVVSPHETEDSATKSGKTYFSIEKHYA